MVEFLFVGAHLHPIHDLINLLKEVFGAYEGHVLEVYGNLEEVMLVQPHSLIVLLPLKEILGDIVINLELGPITYFIHAKYRNVLSDIGNVLPIGRIVSYPVKSFLLSHGCKRL